MIWGAPFSSHYVARDFNTEVVFFLFVCFVGLCGVLSGAQVLVQGYY